MGKILLDAGALLAPVPPVIVTVGEGAEANLITIGWTGVLNTKPPMTYISVRPERHSYGILRRTGEFVINLTDSSMAYAADLCGMYTGRKKDKAALAGLTLEPSRIVRCPSVAKSPLSIECRVERIIPLGSHHVFVARILCVNVRDDLLDEDGRIRLDKADLMAYAHGEYFALGRSLGKFGFSVGKPRRAGIGKTSAKTESDPTTVEDTAKGGNNIGKPRRAGIGKTSAKTESDPTTVEDAAKGGNNIGKPRRAGIGKTSAKTESDPTTVEDTAKGGNNIGKPRRAGIGKASDKSIKPKNKKNGKKKRADTGNR